MLMGLWFVPPQALHPRPSIVAQGVELAQNYGSGLPMLIGTSAVALSPVAFDASSESHTGTTGSTNESSFSWTHTPVGAPAGVLVYTMILTDEIEHATAVTYGGSSLSAVPGGSAADTVGENGRCTAWFLGTSVPTGAQTVTVTRTNDAVVMYAVAFTVTTSSNTAVYTPGIVLIEENSTLAEQSVDDGSPGENSVRFAGIFSGLANPPPAGANSTSRQSIDIGSVGAATVSETVAGQGSRLVGFTSGVTDDVGAVHLAVTPTL
jgi:hypothetical protein